MMNNTYTNVLAACIAFVVAFCNCVDEKSRKILYIVPILRVITLYVVVASACNYDARCSAFERRAMQDWLLGNLFGSGYAQDVSLYWMYVKDWPEEKNPSPSCKRVFERWVLPAMYLALSIAVVYFALEYLLRHNLVFVGAIIGTLVNVTFFYYFVYRASLNSNDEIAIFGREVLLGISVSNVFANWIMYAFSWAPANRAQWAYPTITGVIVTCGGLLLFLVIRKHGSLWCEDTTRLTCKQIAKRGCVPSVTAFAYVFGVGEALSSSGVQLSVTISVIPYVFVIVIPAYAIMREHFGSRNLKPSTHHALTQNPLDREARAFGAIRI